MTISIDTTINSPIKKVWENWTNPSAVMTWNHASDDWYCPKAVNDFTVGGTFSYTMSSTDNKNSFDFFGTYTKIEPLKTIETTLGDGRKVVVEFKKVDDITTSVTESFDTEDVNSADRQRSGWQAILDNFKKYCEEN